MSANPFSSGQNIAIDRSKLITVTSKTVRFEGSVYQTHNISSFTEGEVEIGTVPWIFIIIFIIVGLIVVVLNFDNSANFVLGCTILFIGFLGVASNISNPKQRGFRNLNFRQHFLDFILLFRLHPICPPPNLRHHRHTQIDRTLIRKAID